MKVSSIHTLQSSTSREKLLASVRSLRPFLCESLKRSGCDVLQYTNGDDENDAYVEGQHIDGGRQDSFIVQSQNLCNSGREEHGMSYPQGPQHQMHTFEQEHGLIEGYAQCHSRLRYSLDAHGGHGDEMQDSSHAQQYGVLGYNRIGSANSGTIGVHTEGHDYDGCEPYSYINAEYNGNSNGNINDQLFGHIGHDHEHMYRSPSVPTGSQHMLVSSMDIPGMLNSTLEQSMLLLPDALSSFSSPDEWRLPTEETLQLPPHSHNPYSFLQHDADYHPYNHQNNKHGDQFHPHRDVLDEIAPALKDSVAPDTEARTLGMYRDIAVDKCLAAVAPVLLSPCNEENVTTATCATVPTLPQHWRKREPPSDMTKPLISSDESYALEGEVNDNHSNPNLKAIGSSSNFNSERRRRKKINEALYTLRSVVPIVSKMDKASIVSDALTYVKQLQKQLDDMQNEIFSLQSGKDGVDVTSMDEQVQEESSNSTIQGMDVEKYCQSLPKQKILKLNVISIEKNSYNLQLSCKKAPGDLLQLSRVVEALDFDILNTSVSSIGDHSIINTVVKVDTDAVLTPEELKEMVVEMGSKYGLHL